MSKHTPGPWSVVERKDCVEVRETNPANGSIGISCYGFEAWKQGCSEQVNAAAETRNNEARANARLIAAAPELLMRLRQARTALNLLLPDSKWMDGAQMLADIDAAIAKAEGK